MLKGKYQQLYFKQERRIPDGPEGARQLYNEFYERIKSYFANEEEYNKFLESGFLEIKNLVLIPERLVDALKKGEQSSVDSDTEAIQVVIEDRLVGLLYSRRTEFNNEEVSYLIFEEELQKLRKDIIKKYQK